MSNTKVTSEDVLALREQHLTYRVIAEQLGISRMTAWRLANGGENQNTLILSAVLSSAVAQNRAVSGTDSMQTDTFERATGI